MNISYKVVKLNKRYTGGEYFKYMIEFRPNNISPTYTQTIRFHEVRRWCNDNFGYGVEIDNWVYMYDVQNSHYSKRVVVIPKSISEQWAFRYTYYKNLRIYIRNDESLSHLILSHLDIGK